LERIPTDKIEQLAAAEVESLKPPHGVEAGVTRGWRADTL
jgi:hypothetical protein